MATWIKAGFWQELCKPCNGYKGWLNLTEFVKSIIQLYPFQVRGLFAQTGDSIHVTGTDVETTIINGGVGTLFIPANGFSIGDSFNISASGVINASNNENIRIKVKTGNIILLDSGVQTLTTSIINDIWTFNITFTIRQIGIPGTASVASFGQFNYMKTNNATIQGFVMNSINSTTFDTTSSNTLNVTIQWGTDDVINNIYTDAFVLTKTY